ncbi:XRE family transcriptional regulator [Undibacterium umbellatum]|uniref:Helix-turn-helix transcriptional regulator n=1 Tax=Undibacterium umbellatum TaxID=2762300 RepID=A0ABR6Z378_9BURK|nr:helix-turn-helix transcriptional regulator [Undibacterium umbellatum]MBC3906232.1 helix-turn-helix transcriptional regulator [Undibacterium umbellatum]
MKTLASRLLQARTKKGLSQEQLARLVGVSQSTIGNLEAGIRLTSRNITAIAEALDVDPRWLADGKGTMSATNNDAGSVVALDVPYRPVTIADPNDPEWVEVRKVQLKLAAGISGFSIDHDADDGQSLPFRRGWVEKNGFAPSKLVAIKVKGESMEPSLYDGDTVVINTADIKPKDGEVFAVNYEGEAVVKRMVRDLGQWYLASDNADRKYARKACQDKTCIIIGKVVHKQSDRI